MHFSLDNYVVQDYLIGVDATRSNYDAERKAARNAKLAAARAAASAARIAAGLPGGPMIGRPKPPPVETGETPSQRGQRLRDPDKMNTSGLMRGHEDMARAKEKKEAERKARAATWNEAVAADVSRHLADLPAAIRADELVLKSVRNMVHAQRLFDEFIERKARGEDVDKSEAESNRKLLETLMKHWEYVKSRVPADDGTRTQRVPATVLEWIDAMDERELEVVSG